MQRDDLIGDDYYLNANKLTTVAEDERSDSAFPTANSHRDGVNNNDTNKNDLVLDDQES